MVPRNAETDQPPNRPINFIGLLRARRTVIRAFWTTLYRGAANIRLIHGRAFADIMQQSHRQCHYACSERLRMA